MFLGHSMTVAAHLFVQKVFYTGQSQEECVKEGIHSELVCHWAQYKHTKPHSHLGQVEKRSNQTKPTQTLGELHHQRRNPSSGGNHEPCEPISKL